MRKLLVIRVLVVGLLLTALVLAWWHMPGLRANLDRLPNRLRGLGVLGMATFSVGYIPVSLLLVPGSLIALLGGYTFGMWRGLIVVSLGSVLGACGSFLVSRYLLRGWLEKKLSHSPRFHALDHAVAAQGFKFVFLVRLSPILPYGPLNYAFGLTRISLWRFALASWAGMFPGTLMYVYLGTAAKTVGDITSGNVSGGTGQRVMLFVGLAATVVVTLFVTRLASASLRAALPPADRHELLE